MELSGWIITTAGTIITICMIFIFLIPWKKQRAALLIIDSVIPNEIPAEGVQVPVLNAFAGFKGLAPITFSQNHINPKFILYENYFEYQVFLIKSAKYSEIESLRCYRGRFINKMLFKFSHSNVFYAIFLTDELVLERILVFLAAKGIFPDEGSRL